ncbi:MAG: hypothetical protein IJ368_04410 [Oscillospiraceae bacterium]|nr:hypothetical protein [Oscillospiraceae bacterium]
MKKIMKTIKEYPMTAAMLIAADTTVTVHFTSVSAQKDPTAITYIIALYGTIMAVLLFIAGWVYAKDKAEKKAAEKRRHARRHAMITKYARDFYSITDNI